MIGSVLDRIGMMYDEGWVVLAGLEHMNNIVVREGTRHIARSLTGTIEAIRLEGQRRITMLPYQLVGNGITGEFPFPNSIQLQGVPGSPYGRMMRIELVHRRGSNSGPEASVEPQTVESVEAAAFWRR